MFGKKKALKTQKLELEKISCPVCAARKVDGKVYGEGGRFECKKCGAIFTIEAVRKSER